MNMHTQTHICVSAPSSMGHQRVCTHICLLIGHLRSFAGHHWTPHDTAGHHWTPLHATGAPSQRLDIPSVFLHELRLAFCSQSSLLLAPRTNKLLDAEIGGVTAVAASQCTHTHTMDAIDDIDTKDAVNDIDTIDSMDTAVQACLPLPPRAILSVPRASPTSAA